MKTDEPSDTTRHVGLEQEQRMTTQIDEKGPTTDKPNTTEQLFAEKEDENDVGNSEALRQLPFGTFPLSVFLTGFLPPLRG